MPDDYDRDGDGRHDFRAATISADDDQFVDEEGHGFARGRVEPKDETDRD